MKKNILLYMAAVAGLILAGCNKTEAPEAGSLNMTVKASIGDQTKVAYDGVSTTFQTGDQLAVWAWTGASDVLPQTFVVDGIVNTLDESGKWVPATQMLWKNVKDEHYFLAVHPVPAMAIANLSAVPYAVDNTNYEASDLLLANELTGLKAAAKTVDLTFSHAMAKLQVNLKFRNQFGPGGPAPESVTAALVGKGTAAVNYLTKVVTPTGDEVSVEMAPIATEEGYTMSFAGIQIPQDATKIDVTVGKTIFSYTHPEPLPILPGKVITLGFNVGQDVITLESVSVNDWVFDEPLAGGEAELSAPGTKAADATAEDLDKVIGANGNIYADANAAIAAGTTALAVICYVGNDAETNTTYNHGLALALADANGGNKAAWSSVAANCLDKQYGYGADPTVDMSGIANTDILVSDGHDHDAASAARNYNGGTYPAGTSEWFLPSAGQWQKMITAAGSYANLVSDANLKSENDPYWSSTEKGNGSAWTYAYGKWDYYGGTSFYVRACLAF